MIAVSSARARVDCRAASKARSTAPPKRDCATRLAGEGLQRADRADQFGRVGRGIGERVLRGARAPAHRAARTRRAAARSPGSRASTKSDRRGLVTTIMTDAPTNSTRLRSATDTEAPTALLICVVSAVSREMISPVRAVSKKPGDSSRQMREHVRAQIGDDALADRGDEVVARRRWRPRARPRPRSSRRNS